VVYDITDRSSYEHVRNWLEEIDKYTDQRTHKYIVGNKCDLEERRQVTLEEGEEFSTDSFTQLKNWPFPSDKLPPDSPPTSQNSSRISSTVSFSPTTPPPPPRKNNPTHNPLPKATAVKPSL
jgi:GTPase SAR1 family protein